MSALLLVPVLKTEGRVERRIFEVVRILSDRVAPVSGEAIPQNHEFRD